MATAQLKDMCVCDSRGLWFIALVSVECGLIAFVCMAIYIMADWDESSGVGRVGLSGIILKRTFLP